MLPSTFYHLYNHANGNDNLFRSDENYRYFLQLWGKYTEPVASTYAYCLMPNHFHTLVRISDIDRLRTYFGNKLKSDPTGFDNLSGLISQIFSNLFNAYAKAYNKQHQRMGSLFMRPFKSKELTDEEGLIAVTHYIHSNPVHHGFTERIDKWRWSSYSTLRSQAPTRLKREETISWFGDLDAFIAAHQMSAPRIANEWNE